MIQEEDIIKAIKHAQERHEAYLKYKKIIDSVECNYDTAKIADLYEMYSKSHERNIYNRRIFLFAILFLYCPKRLVGGNISKNLRKLLSRVVGESGENISNDFKLVRFFYEQYKDFRKSATRTIQEFESYLENDTDNNRENAL